MSSERRKPKGWTADWCEMTTRKGVDVEAGPSPEKQVDTVMHGTEDADHPASSSISPDTGIDINEDISTDSFRLQMLSAAGCQTAGDPIPKMHIPIVGYEVMEERARFTVYKLRIENKNSGECWFVFRRYTDFVRLHARLKGDFPTIKLSLPKKRWFGDNFDPDFLEERIEGLQCFINAILDHKELCGAPAVKDFFCIDEPPSYAEGVEESRAIFESLEETIYHLRHQLKERESELSKVRSSLVSESMKKEVVFQFVRNCMKNCPSCSLELSKFGLSDTVKFTSLPQKIHEVKSGDDNGLGDQGEISRTQKDSLNSTSQEVLTVPSF